MRGMLGLRETDDAVITSPTPPLPNDRTPGSGAEEGPRGGSWHVWLVAASSAVAGAVLAIGLVKTLSTPATRPAAEEIVRVIVTTNPELACDVEPSNVRAGVRHVQVIDDSGAVTVLIRSSGGALVFASSGEDVDEESPRRADQEMAKLVAGEYTIECAMPTGHARQQLTVTNP